MKYNLNNKILEAVNRGIKFALDDFEDQEEIQGQSNSKVKHDHGTKEYLEIMEEAIDLGLPSGNLWCKYNLGVNPNQLSKPEDWCGDYYAWGEITRKDEYSWGNYKWVNGPDFDFTKYCNKAGLGFNGYTDNYEKLLPEDDAATQNMHINNFIFHMPTVEDFDELIQYTTTKWYDITNPYLGIKGLTGKLFISKINGNEVFFPVTGKIETKLNSRITSIININTSIDLWTSDIYSNCNYSYQYKGGETTNTITSEFRFYGMPVRGILNE